MSLLLDIPTEYVVKSYNLNSSRRPSSEADTIQYNLTNEEEKRQRYIPHNFYPNLGPRFGRAFSLYIHCLPIHDRKRFKYFFFEKFNIEKFTSDSALREWLTDVSIFSKRNGPRGRNFFGFDPNLAQYLETFGAFQNSAQEDFLESVKSWLTPKDRPSWYFKMFSESMVGSLDYCSALTKPTLSAAEWVVLRTWATPGGSSDKRKITATLYGETVKLTKTKLTTALLLTDTELIELIMLPNFEQVNTAVPKRELSKVRAIISSDLVTYLKMSYVSYYLDQMLAGCPWSTLFMSTTDIYELWHKLGYTSGYNWCFPFDQSAFDQNMNSEFVIDAVKEIRRYTSGIGDCEYICNTLLSSFPNAIVKYLDNIFRLTNGVMSGWRWTSIITTMINRNQLQVWKKYNKYSDNIWLSVFQGDDITMRTGNKMDCVKYFSFMSFLGFKVNPKKVFIDKGRDEYLRKEITPGTVSGYIARSVNTLLWRNPTSPEPPKGRLRCAEQVSAWATFESRGAEKKSIYWHMVRDISGANRIRIPDVESLLRTPKSQGGLGYAIDLHAEWTQLDSVAEQLPAKIEQNLPGLDRTNIFWRHSLEPSLSSLGSWNKNINKFIVEVKAVEKPNFLFFSSRPRAPNSLGIVDSVTMPRWNKDIPPFFHQEYVRSLCDLGRDEDVKIRIENRSVCDYIYTRWGRRLWVKWVTGTLPFSPPLIPLLDPLLVNHCYEAELVMIFNRLLYLPRVTMETVKNAATWLEKFLQDNIPMHLNNPVIKR